MKFLGLQMLNRFEFMGSQGREHLASTQFLFDVTTQPAIVRFDETSILLRFEDETGQATGTQSFREGEVYVIRCINFQDPFGSTVFLERFMKIDGIDVDLYLKVFATGMARQVAMTLVKRVAP